MRITSGTVSHRRHKKVLKRAKGFYGARSKNYKTARQAVRKAMSHSTRDRKQRQRRMRRLWIMRLNAAVRAHGISYSRFIDQLHKNNITIDRKLLSDLAINDKEIFHSIIQAVTS